MFKLKLNNRQNGFTIVELLIVIIVIAVLAAIITISYNGITKRAVDASIISDLQNVATLLENEKTTTGAYPSATTQLNGGGGIQASGQNKLTYITIGTDYCVTVTNSASNPSHISNKESAVTPGACEVKVTTLASGYQSKGITVNRSTGMIYAVGWYNHDLRSITPAGVMTSIVGSVNGYVDGTGSAARLSYPEGVTVDAAGNLYVTDQGNRRIRKVASSAVVTTLAGSGVLGYQDGAGSSAIFGVMRASAVDSAGNVFVADKTNNCIRKILPDGTTSTFAGLCTSGGFADGTGNTARFAGPIGITIDSSGNLFVTDTTSSRIRKVTPGGVVTTIAGTTVGYADGSVATAQFNTPDGITVDAAGNLFVVDTGNNRIRMITSDGQVTTLAGTGAAGFADGGGFSAQFNAPGAITIDPTSALYVTDWGNSRIRKITL